MKLAQRWTAVRMAGDGDGSFWPSVVGAGGGGGHMARATHRAQVVRVHDSETGTGREQEEQGMDFIGRAIPFPAAASSPI